jgi:hypothetical protein
VSEQASEAGTRWQNRVTGGGPERTTARAAFVRALVDGSHPGPSHLALSFDEGVAEAGLALEAGSPPAGWRDRG